MGIVGLPNVGKSTLFKALTKKQVDIAAYPFTTISPNVGVVPVPDERLEKIAEIVKPEKITPTVIEFVDIAGLVKGAYKGEGLGNQFLARIRECDAILELLRGFEDPKVENVLREVNPLEEIEVIKTELLMKDLETLDGLIQKMEKDSKRDKGILKKFELLKIIKNEVSQGKSISEVNLSEEEKVEIKEYQLLTTKPVIYVLNFNKQEEVLPQFKEKFRTTIQKLPPEVLLVDLKFEEELSEFPEEEARQLRSGFSSPLESIIIICYNVLDLITFYTIVGLKETRAWTLKKGSNALEASGKIHSDFQEKFIKADVIPWQKLITVGSWQNAREKGWTPPTHRPSDVSAWAIAREKGWIKIVGKDYVVQDGDIIEFKI